MEKNEMRKNGDGFVDRSRVRILVCDNDEGSSEEVSTLLCKCSYQVISVKSPRQVVDALNAEGNDIDIILSEVDLPMSKGLKMLKYIMRDKELRRIPVIMMSAQDEVPIVVKCLKFGAVDYLVKPLRMNELLNLWTHMWRRRRTLGLIEKNIMSYNYDLVISDHSDANTNSTTLISDDIEERSLRSTNPEALVSIHQEDDTNTTAAAPISIGNGASSACQPDVPSISDRRTGQMPSFPKRSELKIGEFSAFFTYIKTDMSKGQSQGVSLVHETTRQHTKTVQNSTPGCQVDPIVQDQDRRETAEKHTLDYDYLNTNSIPEFLPTPSNSKNEVPLDYAHLGKDSLNGVIGGYAHTPYPYHMSRVMNQVMVPLPSVYQKNELNMQNGAGAALLMQYNQIPQCPRIPAMEPYPYYPFTVCLQPDHPPAPHPSCSPGNPFSNEAKSSEVGRREAALMKFRQKRKERCFNKKIRYVNRKILAERRPRLRGQFIRKVNGIDVDLNGLPDSADAEEEEDEEAYEAGILV